MFRSRCTKIGCIPLNEGLDALKGVILLKKHYGLKVNAFKLGVEPLEEDVDALKEGADALKVKWFRRICNKIGYIITRGRCICIEGRCGCIDLWIEES